MGWAAFFSKEILISELKAVPCTYTELPKHEQLVSPVVKNTREGLINMPQLWDAPCILSSQVAALKFAHQNNPYPLALVAPMEFPAKPGLASWRTQSACTWGGCIITMG